MDSEMLGRVISTARKQKNLSQKELGDLLNVSNKAVSKWENGEATPRPETLIKLCDILELNKTEILGFEQKYDSKEIDSLKSRKQQAEKSNRKHKQKAEKSFKIYFHRCDLLCYFRCGSIVFNFKKFLAKQ